MVGREGTRISSSSCSWKSFSSADLPRADLSTELLAKGGAPLPIESKKELSNFRYSMAPENSLKQEVRQTFAMLSNRRYQSLKAFLISHKAFLNDIDPLSQQKVQALQVTQHCRTEETAPRVEAHRQMLREKQPHISPCKETSTELETTWESQLNYSDAGHDVHYKLMTGSFSNTASKRG